MPNHKRKKKARLERIKELKRSKGEKDKNSVKSSEDTETKTISDLSEDESEPKLLSSDNQSLSGVTSPQEAEMSSEETPTLPEPKMTSEGSSPSQDDETQNENVSIQDSEARHAYIRCKDDSNPQALQKINSIIKSDFIEKLIGDFPSLKSLASGPLLVETKDSTQLKNF